MATCPRGHSSVATDYCDECGTPINAPMLPAPIAEVTPASVGWPAPAAGGQECPDCGSPRSGRFCEVDGFDFEAQTPPAQKPAPDSTTSTPQPDGISQTAVTGTSTPTPTPSANGVLRLVVAADRAYHERMAAVDAPDAESVAFPVFCPERRFTLAEGQQLLIGRRSRSRGIEPNIDLTGPPEDVGVSHAHAVLMSTSDGAWTVVDLGSSNGTYLNDSTDPLKPNVPTPVKQGDQIHLGAWTTLTITS
ncbi:FHA domain-containing protein [Dactylosporangium darangshiense]|uniref:FHA domain-containing protein n=1 Tax=Dactylosporangium darangshiense TaxID=579108 RepID=A0ABP8DQ71_9ACTN